MASIAVIYKSKYGATKRYAQWIAEALEAKLLEKSQVTPSQLATFDVVIYGGALYGGGINGVELVTKNPCKSLVVFTVGLANPETTDYTPVLKENFSPELRLKVFHLRGGMDYKKLGFIHKCMMGMLRKSTLKKPESERSDEDRLFLQSYGGTVDFVNKQSIVPLINFVKELAHG